MTDVGDDGVGEDGDDGGEEDGDDGEGAQGRRRRGEMEKPDASRWAWGKIPATETCRNDGGGIAMSKF